MLTRALGTVMALLLAAAAAVQLNDPDPLIWIAMYLACAAASVVVCWGLLRVRAEALVVWSVALLGWSGWLALRVLGKQELLESEEGREMLGLALCGLWSLALAWMARRHAVRSSV